MTAAANGRATGPTIASLEDRARSLLDAANSQAQAEQRRWAHVKEHLGVIFTASTTDSLRAADECEQILLAHRRNQGLIYAGVRAVIEAAAGAIDGDRAPKESQDFGCATAERMAPAVPGWPGYETLGTEDDEDRYVEEVIGLTLDAYAAHATDGEQRDERRRGGTPIQTPDPTPISDPPFDPDPPQPQGDPGPAQVPPPAENVGGKSGLMVPPLISREPPASDPAPTSTHATPERLARLRGYEGEPCPACKKLTLVRSGQQWACDFCGARDDGESRQTRMMHCGMCGTPQQVWADVTLEICGVCTVGGHSVWLAEGPPPAPAPAAPAAAPKRSKPRKARR